MTWVSQYLNIHTCYDKMREKWEIEKLMEKNRNMKEKIVKWNKVNLKNVCDEDSNSITRYDKLRIDNA